MLQEFDYIAPKTLKNLLTLLKEKQDKIKILAGGTDLLVDTRAGLHNYEMVVDIKKIPEFLGITWEEEEGLSIKAAATMHDLMMDKNVKKYFPLLIEAAHQVASPQLRNRATVVGNLCTASPCTDLGRALVAFDATVEILSVDGLRQINISEFFKGVKQTSLAPHEVVSRVIIPPELANAEGGHEKLKRIKGHDLAVASVSIVKKDKLLRIAVGACGRTVVLVPGVTSASPIKTILAKTATVVKPIDDVRATADYRRFMVDKFITRIMERMG